MPNSILEIRNLTFTWNNGIKALQGINLKVENGDFITILGPNGSGKSTLLNLIMGNIDANRGQKIGEIILSDDIYSTERKNGIGYLSQEITLFPWLSVKKNIEFGLRTKKLPKKQREDILKDVILKFNLSEYIDMHPHQLSGGMRQRVQFARTYAIKPKLFLMDEPFGALDPNAREEMHKILLEIYKEGWMTVLFITHNLTEARILSKRYVILRGGPSIPGQIVATINQATLEENPIEASRAEKAISKIFWGDCDEPLSLADALEYERHVITSSKVIIIGLFPEREYADIDKNQFFPIICQNISNRVKYTYIFPNYSGYNSSPSRYEELPPNLKNLIQAIKIKTKINDIEITKLLRIYVAPTFDIFKISGDCAIIECDGRPKVGWYFPNLLDTNFIFKFSQKELEKIYNISQRWETGENFSIKLFPL